MPKDKKISKPTQTHLSGKGLKLNPQLHRPMDVAHPKRVTNTDSGHTIISLEDDLDQVEKARLEAMMRLGDESGFKGFMRPTGAGIAGGSAASALPSLFASGQISFTAVGIFILGVILAIIGHMSLADTRAEIEVQARDYDRDRILRAIERLDHATEHIEAHQAKTPPAEANQRSWRQIFSCK